MLQRWPWHRPACRNSSRPDDCKIPRAGYATWSCRCICDILVWQNHHVKGILCHVKWPWSIVNAIQARPTTEIHDMSVRHCQSRYRCCQVAQYGGTHSAALRSALLPFPASSLPRELVSGRHLPLPEAVGWPRPPYCTIWQTTCRLRPSPWKTV